MLPSEFFIYFFGNVISHFFQGTVPWIKPRTNVKCLVTYVAYMSILGLLLVGEMDLIRETKECGRFNY